MSSLKKRVYLASRSPRRRELLKQIGVEFELLLLREGPHRERDVDETPLPYETPADYAVRVARAKAHVGWLRLAQRGLPRLLPRCPLLAADTTVALEGEILGKPADGSHAAEILRRLSGRTHEVYTAVALALDGEVDSMLCVSSVTFKPLSEAEIQAYVATGEPLDKAGAYAIQGLAAVFVASLEGSYSGVVGLPLYETAQLLKKYGYPVP